MCATTPGINQFLEYQKKNPHTKMITIIISEEETWIDWVKRSSSFIYNVQLFLNLQQKCTCVFPVQILGNKQKR